MYVLCAIDTSSYGCTLPNGRASWWHGTSITSSSCYCEYMITFYVSSLLSYFPLTCDCLYGSVVQKCSRNLNAFGLWSQTAVLQKFLCQSLMFEFGFVLLSSSIFAYMFVGKSPHYIDHLSTNDFSWILNGILIKMTPRTML